MRWHRSFGCSVPSVGFAIGVAVANIARRDPGAGLARRVGGASAALVVTALSGGLAWSMGSELLFDAWQPHAMLLPGLGARWWRCGRWRPAISARHPGWWAWPV